MNTRTADIRIREQRPLPSPALLQEQLPLPDRAAAEIEEARAAIAAIFTGADDRLLVVVGPCSIHDPLAALDYARRLSTVASDHGNELLIAMRVYFEKPRTTVGWKGFINDPFLDESFQIDTGLKLARKLMLDFAALGLPIATEFLDTTLGQFYADLVSWGAIGARTVESQVHRELASGLSMPVGFKNRTDGDVQVAIDAIRSARHPHWFPSLTRDGVPAILGTTGNEHAHLVLRGGTSGPNYSPDHIRDAGQRLKANGLPPRLMVDCSHANSGKDAERQMVVAAQVAGQIKAGEPAISAVMLESNVRAGMQDHRARPLAYGQSVTDACLGWEDTLPLFALLGAAVCSRRTMGSNAVRALIGDDNSCASFGPPSATVAP